MGLNDDNLRSAFCVPNSYFQINVVNVSIIRHSNQSVHGNGLLIKMHFEARPDNDAEVGISFSVQLSLWKELSKRNKRASSLSQPSFVRARPWKQQLQESPDDWCLEVADRRKFHSSNLRNWPQQHISDASIFGLWKMAFNHHQMGIHQNTPDTPNFPSDSREKQLTVIVSIPQFHRRTLKTRRAWSENSSFSRWPRPRIRPADHYNEIPYQNILICFYIFIIS